MASTYMGLDRKPSDCATWAAAACCALTCATCACNWKSPKRAQSKHTTNCARSRRRTRSRRQNSTQSDGLKASTTSRSLVIAEDDSTANGAHTCISEDENGKMRNATQCVVPHASCRTQKNHNFDRNP